MTTLTVSLLGICSGNTHFRVSFRKDADAVRAASFDVDEIRDPITREEFDIFARIILKLRSEGKTKLQFKNDLQAGFEVTI